MSEKKTYIVNRAMHGDGKDYARGDTRQLTEADAALLVQSGALTEKGGKTAEREPTVRHTFGNEPSKVNDEGYTSATGESVSVRKPAAKGK
jgi:hypothetical protein